MRQAALNYRATPALSGRRNRAPAAALPRSGLPPSGRTGCATGSLRTGAPPWPAAAETCHPTAADAPEWPRASAAGFSAAPTFPSLWSFLLSVRMCARNISTVKRLLSQCLDLPLCAAAKRPGRFEAATLVLPLQVPRASEVARENDAENGKWIPGDDEQRTVVETIHGIEHRRDAARGQTRDRAAQAGIKRRAVPQRRDEHCERASSEDW